MKTTRNFRIRRFALVSMTAAGLLAASCTSSGPTPSSQNFQGQRGPGMADSSGPPGAPPGGFGSGQPSGQPPQGQPPQGSPPGGQGPGSQTKTLASQATSKYFTDLTSATSDINAAVDELYTKGLFQTWGTTFRPNQTLTRAELAALLMVRYQGKATIEAIERPEEPVTHQEAAEWIFSAEQKYGMPQDRTTTDLSAVSDRSAVAASAQKAVATMLRLGVLKTTQGAFEPQGTYTRAQIVPVLYQLWSLGGAPKAQGGPGNGGPGGQGGPGGMPPGGGNQTMDQGKTANTVSADVTGTSYASKGDTENALRISGSSTKVTLTSITVTKAAGAAGSGDNSSFYGNNAAVLVTDGAQATLKGAQVSSSARGANGIFVYGASSKATVSDAVIRTTQDASGGIMVAGGGTAVVTNAAIDTQGASSAALRSDRGGGTLTVDGGTYTAHGDGSPAVYSTAAITVRNATLTATGSEAVVVEGKNSVTIVDSSVTGQMIKSDVESLHNVMIYQSMSGDAAVGRSSFTMTGGSLTSLAGDQFYVTNTAATVNLTNVKITNFTDTLLKVVGNDARRGWGKVGSNGGDLAFTASQQVLNGSIVVDALSKLALSLTNGSSFTGTINETAQKGSVAVALDASSSWSLTADAHVSSFTGSLDRVMTNGHHLFVNGKAVN